MESHFIFQGPETERTTARERVRRALLKDAENPRHYAGSDRVTDLDAYLKDHYIRAIPTGKALHVEITPATSPALWAWFFDVTEGDTMANSQVETIAPPPR